MNNSLDWLVPPGWAIDLPTAGSVGELLLKILFLFGFLLYVVFAFVVIRQVRLMQSTFRTPLGPVLMIIAIAHFVVSLAVLVFAFFVL